MSLAAPPIHVRSSVVTSFSTTQRVVDLPALCLRYAQPESPQMGFKNLGIPGEPQEHKIWRSTGPALSSGFQKGEIGSTGLTPGQYFIHSPVIHSFIQ